MEDFIQRIRNAFRRTADRVAGRYVPIQMQSPGWPPGFVFGVGPFPT